MFFVVLCGVSVKQNSDTDPARPELLWVPLVTELQGNLVLHSKNFV